MTVSGSRDQRFFCSVASQANRECIYGTVARIRSWLLLEYPGVWRHDAVGDSRLLSPEVKQHIRRLDLDRVLLVRQQHTPRCPLRAFFVYSRPETPHIQQHNVAEYDELRRLSPNSPGTAVNDVMFAVCTHARHDKCCAKFGMPVWCALQEVTPERAWQCSHVGGDRFAANVVVMPYGIYYGRVEPEDVPELVRRTDAGEIWLPGYRGRSCYGRAVQIAEYFLRSESGQLGIDAFNASNVTTEPAATTVSFVDQSDSVAHRVTFRTRENVLRQRLTCAAEEESGVSQYELVSYTLSHI